MAKTESALADMLAADLSGLDLVALMIDGVHFADHLCVVALGIGLDGTKHPLGVVEGDTENATVVKDLLAGLRERGPALGALRVRRYGWETIGIVRIDSVGEVFVRLLDSDEVTGPLFQPVPDEEG